MTDPNHLLVEEIERKCSEAAGDELLTAERLLLVVDDDEHVLEFETEVLSLHGFRVLRARSAEEALKVAAEFGDQLALLVTDVHMPGMNGIELADLITEACPHIQTLVISALPDSYYEFVTRLSRARADFLLKPLTTAKLLERVQALLQPTPFRLPNC